MKATYRLAAAAVLAALLSACGAGVGVSGVNGHVGARGSVDLGNGNSSVTPYGKAGGGGGAGFDLAPGQLKDGCQPARGVGTQVELAAVGGGAGGVVEMEVRELLSQYEFPGDDIPVVAGSALKALEGDDAMKAKILELMDAVDSYIPTPTRNTEKPFLMPVEDVFTITGRGTVATGRVERGELKLNDTVEIVGLQDEARSTVVTGIEMFRKLLDSAVAGDNIGALLRGVDRKDIERGQVLAKPGSINPHTKFKAQVYVLTKEEGGRHTPFFTNYRPQFYFRTTDVTGVVRLPEGTEMVMPGDNVEMEVELITPIAIEQGLRFAIREGGHTVGAGRVTAIEG